MKSVKLPSFLSKSKKQKHKKNKKGKSSSYAASTSTSTSTANGVDFRFIQQLEGTCREGYVPDAKNSRSGVTIASGFDIGQRDSRELERLFPRPLAQRLTPYANLHGKSAQKQLSKKPLKVSDEEVELINRVAKNQALTGLEKQWNKAGYCSFCQLSRAQQTVVASVAFQYGDLSRRTPKLWSYATKGDWGKVHRELLNFGDRYPTRRRKEAQLLVD
ncbi:pesticin C-terminus-like muramidase [Vibrio sp. Of7-15]|uniref:pesticin C-terminus-like muramidase n=1 Tax=Vibrio sp. Of7-15 TaxID=2724879 RepID=UPI001EF2A357|nr:pesticin C-terminus-like muramidase [Vibrio sp. Of7-15]